MSGETNIDLLIRNMTPQLNVGEYVFLSLKNLNEVDRADTVFEFKEKEGITIVIEKDKAIAMNFDYEGLYAWISLHVHSSLEAVGLTALFSTELAKHTISCNVVAGYFHDHIFVPHKDAEKAMKVLTLLSKNHN